MNCTHNLMYNAKGEKHVQCIIALCIESAPTHNIKNILERIIYPQQIIFCSSRHWAEEISIVEVVRLNNAGKSYSMKCELVTISAQYMCVLININ
jgi:hypothetical protein